MPIHLVIAYAVFIAVPAGLSISIAIRKRKVERRIEKRRAEFEG